MTEYRDAATRVRAGGDPTIEARALVAAMTPDELLECLDGDLDFWPGLADMIGGGYHEHTYAGAACARLGIPGIAFSDGPRGVVVGQATCFPVSMARAATWDPDLEERIGDAIGRELRRVGANLYGGVCVNLLRHPAWGRAQETYGEDPVLLGEMGAALTRGAQRSVMACVKHFALNSMENARFTVDVTVDDRVLHEVYLAHFERIVAEGVASVMSAYNSVNGEWCGQHRALLTDILREQWGFAGFVISDFVSGTRSGARSVRAGLDIEMPFRMVRHQLLRDELAAGEITHDELSASVERTVAALLRFQHVIDDSATIVVDDAAHAALAREAAARSIVLLTNDGVVPCPTPRRVVVVGRLAAEQNLGDRGSSRVFPATVVTPWDGLRARFGADQTEYDDGSDLARAASLAAGADLVVLVVGMTHLDEGEYIGLDSGPDLRALYPPQTPDTNELLQAAFARVSGSGQERAMGTGGDRQSLRLHDTDEALIRAVSAANPHTVIAVMSGSAVVMPWVDLPAATLMLWYPGQEGGNALADVIAGDVPPSGRLPFTIPVDESDLPFFDRHATEITYDRWHGYTKLQHDGVRPAFAFGSGLTYTTFEISAAAWVDTGDDLELAVTVTNTGDRSGSHVVQVYAGLPGSSVERAERLLVGFARTAEIAPGQRSTVRVTVLRRRLGVWRPEHQAWWIEPGEYRFEVSHSSADHAHVLLRTIPA
jgi:beta-glucosidase